LPELNKMIFKAIIVEDEENAASLLQTLLGKLHPDIEIKEVCANAKDGLLAVFKHKPDIIFLDIQMPDMTGLEFFEKLKELKHPVQAIITTAFSEHGYYKKAIQLGLADYLLKPIIPEDLDAAVASLKKKILENMQQSKVDHIVSVFKEEEKICLSTGSSKIFIKPSTILYAVSDGKCSKLVFTSQQEETVMHGIGELSDLLPASELYKIDRFTIVNKSYIHKISPRLKIIVFEYNNHQCQLNVSHTGAMNLLEMMDNGHDRILDPK
jgi:two-component system, LytTR family, response regulator